MLNLPSEEKSVGRSAQKELNRSFSFTFLAILGLVLVLAERVWAGPDELEVDQEPQLPPPLPDPPPLPLLLLHLRHLQPEHVKQI